MRHFSSALIVFVAVSAHQALPAKVPATADFMSRLEGTWVIDTSQDKFSGRPVSRLVKNGMCRCGDCVTKVEVPTDGRFHKFEGGQDFDEVAVTIRDRRQVDFRYRKAGKLAETETERVSPNGRILTFRNVNFTAPNGKPTVSEGQRRRVGRMPTGAHLVSGDWRQMEGAKESAEALTLVIRTSGDRVTIIQPTGRQVSALIGGKPEPLVGDQAGRFVRMEVVPPQSLRTVTSIAGKDVQNGLITLAPDGKSLTFGVRDLSLGQEIRFVALKR